jgi:hypothetical protein
MASVIAGRYGDYPETQESSYPAILLTCYAGSELEPRRRGSNGPDSGHRASIRHRRPRCGRRTPGSRAVGAGVRMRSDAAGPRGRSPYGKVEHGHRARFCLDSWTGWTARILLLGLFRGKTTNVGMGVKTADNRKTAVHPVQLSSGSTYYTPATPHIPAGLQRDGPCAADSLSRPNNVRRAGQRRTEQGPACRISPLCYNCWSDAGRLG